MGLTVDDVASRLKRRPEEIIAWEEGRKTPTYRQLEELAGSLYKRPLAIFFFPEPPEEDELQTEFRTLPAAELEEFLPDTRFAIREARARQQSLRELTGARNPAARLITREIGATPSDSTEELAIQVRRYLDISVVEQQSWANQAEAFKQWRSAVESVGVFVFKRSFKQREISGLCLYDPTFPIIVVNNSTAPARQEFTLFHELAHLLFGVSGIADDRDLAQQLAGPARAIEIACNRFAAEVLLPAASLSFDVFRQRDLVEAVTEVAATFNVSRELVLRRLLDRGWIERQQYNELVQRWNHAFEQRRAESSGGNYYATQVAYLGTGYLRLAFDRYQAGQLSVAELADHLGVKARNIGELEEAFRRSG